MPLANQISMHRLLRENCVQVVSPRPFIRTGQPAMGRNSKRLEVIYMPVIARSLVFATSALALSFVLALVITTSSSAGPVTLSKDQGPASVRCDRGDVNWRACVEATAPDASPQELFYAGYWLAKSGSYQRALSYLRAADQNDPRVATYVGYALRKLGHVDKALPYYTKALTLDPNFNVARAYLGEAHLTQGRLDAAEHELSEIARRCGVHCVEHIDLAGHIASYKAATRSAG